MGLLGLMSLRSGGPSNSSQSDTLQVKSPILVKQVVGVVSPFVFYEPSTGADYNMYIVFSIPISSKRLYSSGSDNTCFITSGLKNISCYNSSVFIYLSNLNISHELCSLFSITVKKFFPFCIICFYHLYNNHCV